MRGRERGISYVRSRNEVTRVTSYHPGYHLNRVTTLMTRPCGGFCIPMTEQLRVEYRKIETLIPFARNPRTHSEAQIAKLASSIVEFGWTQPILNRR